MKLFASLFLFFLLLVHYVKPKKQRTEIIEEDIVKGVSDRREYRIIKLYNGIEAVLIHDPLTLLSAASLSVGIGSMSDPVDFPGLAHLCEHLLFLGTEKYPIENEFSLFISKHNGFFNAFTTHTETNYIFDINNRYFYEALDRMANFFIKPLFMEDVVLRESNSVDLEYKKSLLSIDWHLLHLQSHLSNQNHPFSKFLLGNRESLITGPKLKGKNILMALHKFIEDNYSPEIMKLAIYGNQSLDILQQYAEKTFVQIPSRKSPPPYEGNPLDGQLGINYYYKSSQSNNVLQLEFPIQDQNRFYKSQPFTYLQYIFTYQGQGSVLEYLMNNDLASEIKFDYLHINKDTDILYIIIYSMLDPSEYKTLVEAIFACLKYYRELGPQKKTFDELKLIQQINFDYKVIQKPFDYVSNLSSTLQNSYLPRKLLLRADVINEYDENEIIDFFNSLTPKNFRSSLQLRTDIDYDNIEHYYGIQYKIESYDPEFLEKLENVPSITLMHPSKNKYISRIPSITMEKLTQDNFKPNLLKETNIGAVWHRYTSLYHEPRGVVYVLFSNPLAYLSSFHFVNLLILEKYLALSLSDEGFYSSMAGITFSFEASNKGLQLLLYAFNDQIMDMFYKIASILQNVMIDDVMFQLILDRVYDSFSKHFEEPFSHASKELHTLLSYGWQNEELTYELEKLKYSEFNLFLYEFFSNLHIDMLVTGNVPSIDVIHMYGIVEYLFEARPLIPFQQKNPRTITLDYGSYYVHKLNASDNNEINSAVSYYCEVTDIYDMKKAATFDVLSIILANPLYEVLRTKEQLAYTIKNKKKVVSTVLGYQIIVESERKPHVIEKRIRIFLDEFINYLNKLTDEEIGSYIEASIYSYQRIPLTMLDEAKNMWAEIISGTYKFEPNDEIVEYLKKVKKSDIIDLFLTSFHNYTSIRKVSYHVSSLVDDFYHLFDIPFNKLSSYLIKKGQNLSETDFNQIVSISINATDFVTNLLGHFIKKVDFFEKAISLVNDTYAFLKNQYLLEKEELLKESGAVIENLMAFKTNSTLSREIVRKSLK